MEIRIGDLSLGENFHEIIMESIGVGIIATDLNGNILTINQAAEEMWDCPREMGRGYSFLLLLAEQDRASMQKTFDYVATTGKALRATDVEFTNRAGKKILINSYASIFNEPSNQTIGVVMWTEDITEENEIRNKVKIASNLHEIVVESIGTGIIAVDLDGKIMTINKAAQEMYATPKEAALGQSFLIGLAEHERDRFLKTHNYVVRTGQAFHGSEIKLVNWVGKTIYINAYSALIKGPEGEIFGLAMLTEDITRRKILEQGVQRADKLAALGQLSLGLSHEIRTPLANIKALSTLIKNNVSLDEQKYKYLNVIIEEVNRIDRLSRELLDFAGSGNLSFTMVNINTLMTKVLFLSKLNKPSATIVFEERLQSNLPLLYGDPEKLVHTFLNLIINAMEAIEDEGWIRIETLAIAGWVIIKVSDSGIGIPTADLAKIFDPFYTSKESGTGLGLSIVHTIITEHNGYIYVESQENKGTTFTVKLPIAKGDLE